MPELVFKGKEYVYNHHLTVPYRPLIARAKKSIGSADLAGNLIIHGDNLHALKSLLPRYTGKVNCIYIDPPYNTGEQTWSYNDNVNSPLMRNWLEENPVNHEDMLRHDKWLCMMYPRLRLLAELLTENGVIFVSINDVEVSNLRLAMDEVFGEESFIGQLVWKSRQNKDNRNKSGLSIDHEYILCYGRKLTGAIRKTEQYTNPDQDKRGPWTSGNMVGLASKEDRPNLHYDLINPETKINYGCPDQGWRYEPSTMSRLIVEKRILWPRLSSGRPREKVFLDELETDPNISSIVGSGLFTRDGTNELEEIFGSKQSFKFPKPSALIRELIVQGGPSNGIFLDSFAGSGTTAQAVITQNAADGGDRRFILVECEDYAEQLTAERVRRVIGGYAFQGVQRKELLREKITWSKLQKVETLISDIEEIRKREGVAEKKDLASDVERRFDRVNAKVEDGDVVVEGERRISKRVKGLGGEFTFCTLGEPIDPEGILSGKTLPDYENLAALLYYTATGGALNKKKVKPKIWYLGEAQNRHLWLVYKPDLGFLKSTEAALTLSLAKKLREKYPNKGHLVFAPAKFLSNKQLLEHGVEYAPLPFALYREV